MTLKYFGTDGIRGRVNGPLMNQEFLRKVGRALGRYFTLNDAGGNPQPTVVTGRDTRESGTALEQALADGLESQGVKVVRLGVIPTPAVSLAVRDMGAALGIALTASHNPVSDNGIKLFDSQGLKCPIAVEAEIETLIEQEPDCPHPLKHASIPQPSHDIAEAYCKHRGAVLPPQCLAGWKIVLDTANGATAVTSPWVLRHLGAELVLIGEKPDGRNINCGVGSEHPQRMCAAVVESHARLGIAHDGDGDRVVICDEHGTLLEGDKLLGLLALHALRNGKLNKHTLVTTIQSNFGLDSTLEQAGGKVDRVGIGDRNVLRHMWANGLNLGGESSGHLIFLDHAVAGDGLLGALKTIEIMLATGKSLAELGSAVTLFPQMTMAIEVSHKRPLEECPNLVIARTEVERALHGCGRLLVRYSGTEAKLRLLVEAETQSSLKTCMQQLCEAAHKDLPTV